MLPSSRPTSTSTVGLPRESRISRATTTSMDGTSISFLGCDAGMSGPRGCVRRALRLEPNRPRAVGSRPTVPWTDRRYLLFPPGTKVAEKGCRETANGQKKPRPGAYGGTRTGAGGPWGRGRPHGLPRWGPGRGGAVARYGQPLSLQVQLLARVDEVRVLDDVLVQLEQLLPAALDVVLLGDGAEGVALDDLVLAVALLDLLAGRGGDGLGRRPGARRSGRRPAARSERLVVPLLDEPEELLEPERARGGWSRRCRRRRTGPCRRPARRPCPGRRGPSRRRRSAALGGLVGAARRTAVPPYAAQVEAENCRPP